MPTVFTHPVVPLVARAALGKEAVSKRLLAAGIACSVAPDLDVLMFYFGAPYWSALGHRGFTHSLFFALVLAALCTVGHRALRASPGNTFAFTFVSAASHGLLDAFTNGGLGIALFWPFSAERFFFYPRVLAVSPLGLAFLDSAYAWQVLRSELLWVWLPCAMAVMLGYLVRRVLMRATQ